MKSKGVKFYIEQLFHERALDMRYKGLYATTTPTPMKTPLENISSRNLYCFVIIPIRSPCIMWLSYSATEQVGTVFLLAQRMKKKKNRQVFTFSTTP